MPPVWASDMARLAARNGLFRALIPAVLQCGMVLQRNRLAVSRLAGRPVSLKNAYTARAPSLFRAMRHGECGRRFCPSRMGMAVAMGLKSLQCAFARMAELLYLCIAVACRQAVLAANATFNEQY